MTCHFGERREAEMTVVTKESGQTERGRALTLCLIVFLALDAGLLVFGL
jgi:hypothetical protein